MALAVRGDPPDLTRAGFPVRVAGVQRAVLGDGEIVRLVHRRVVNEDGNRTGGRIDTEHVVAGVVGNEHDPLWIEPDAIPSALFGKCDEEFRAAVRRHAPDVPGFTETDAVQDAGAVAGGAFDAAGEFTGRQERGLEERVLRSRKGHCGQGRQDRGQEGRGRGSKHGG